MEDLARVFCQQEGLSLNNLKRLSGGQLNHVFLVGDDYILRIGSGKEASQRLKCETEILQSLAGQVPVPQVCAFGQRDDYFYQVQHFIQGEKLHRAWANLPAESQDQVVAELASYLKIVHTFTFERYGYPQENAQEYGSWPEFWADRLEEVLIKVRSFDPHLDPDLLELVTNYFEKNKHALRGGTPALVHGDLWPGNILVKDGRVVAILDFELAMHAPKDYELARIEEFCLYPNDYAEEDNEVYCVTDWAHFFQLFRKHCPELFEVEHLRERVDLYHLIGSLHSYVDWEGDKVEQNPVVKAHTMARVTNFVFDHGVRMFIS